MILLVPDSYLITYCGETLRVEEKTYSLTSQSSIYSSLRDPRSLFDIPYPLGGMGGSVYNVVIGVSIGIWNGPMIVRPPA
jgi:hypothetical protein